MSAVHHPAHHSGDGDLELRPIPARARITGRYDVVLKGKASSTAARSVSTVPAMQSEALRALGIDETQQRQQFGFLLDALSFGAPPPACGLALGLDRRLCMLWLGELDPATIAFPKTQRHPSDERAPSAPIRRSCGLVLRFVVCAGSASAPGALRVRPASMGRADVGGPTGVARVIDGRPSARRCATRSRRVARLRRPRHQAPRDGRSSATIRRPRSTSA